MAVRCVGSASGADVRLGCLFPLPRDAQNAAWFDKLRRVGFFEGQNLIVEYRSYGQHVDLMPQYAAELVKGTGRVIAAAGDETVRAVQQAKKPSDRRALGDMLGSELVTSLARPDGNTTGVSILTREANGKRQDPDRSGAGASSDGRPDRSQLHGVCES